MCEKSAHAGELVLPVTTHRMTGKTLTPDDMGPRISSEAAPSYCPPEAQAALDQILEEDREIFEALARCSNTNTKKRNKPQ